MQQPLVTEELEDEWFKRDVDGERIRVEMEDNLDVVRRVVAKAKAALSAAATSKSEKAAAARPWGLREAVAACRLALGVERAWDGLANARTHVRDRAKAEQIRSCGEAMELLRTEYRRYGLQVAGPTEQPVVQVPSGDDEEDSGKEDGEERAEAGRTLMGLSGGSPAGQGGQLVVASAGAASGQPGAGQLVARATQLSETDTAKTAMRAMMQLMTGPGGPAAARTFHALAQRARVQREMAAVGCSPGELAAARQAVTRLQNGDASLFKGLAVLCNLAGSLDSVWAVLDDEADPAECRVCHERRSPSELEGSCCLCEVCLPMARSAASEAVAASQSLRDSLVVTEADFEREELKHRARTADVFRCPHCREPDVLRQVDEGAGGGGAPGSSSGAGPSGEVGSGEQMTVGAAGLLVGFAAGAGVLPSGSRWGLADSPVRARQETLARARADQEAAERSRKRVQEAGEEEERMRQAAKREQRWRARREAVGDGSGHVGEVVGSEQWSLPPLQSEGATETLYKRHGDQHVVRAAQSQAVQIDGQQGLFAVTPIRKGALFGMRGRETARTATLEEARERGRGERYTACWRDPSQGGCYRLIQLDAPWAYANDPRNTGREANLRFVTRGGKPVLEALHDIPAGTELLWEYGDDHIL